MKKLSITALTVLCFPILALLASGASASDLIFSEYIEGSSYNKALEIYNGTGAPVDLGDYRVEVYFNGSSAAGTSLTLSGTLADGDVFVLAHSSADSAVLAVADQTYGGSLYNGDDAVALVGPNGFADVIGQIGVDPGSQWGDSSLGTQNQTLIRNSAFTSGRSDGSGSFDPADEWQSTGLDSFADLGSYTGSGGNNGGDNGNGGGVAQCGAAATPISSVQGSGAASPLVGERVEIEAVVVGDFQDTATGLGGFFLQEEDADRDNQAATSEGLFVYDNGFGTDVQPGDLVRVGGVVKEQYDLTELAQVDGVSVCGSGYSVSPAEIDLPLASADALERYEGMLAHFPQTLTVSGNYNLGRYGEVDLSLGRLYTPTNIAEPGAAALAQQSANALNRILLDDASTVQNPAVIPYPAPELRADNSLRTGASVSDLRGVIGYSFGRYRVQPVETPQFADTNPRTSAPALPGIGNLRVASFNVLNFFNGSGSFNGDGSGFPTSRGADTYEEFQRQRDKIVSAILGTGADIVGLMEIENDGYGSASAIAELVDALNSVAGGQVYAFVDPGLAQLGSDAIAVGLIYRRDRVAPLGNAATLQNFPFDDLNRQPLLQAFTQLTSGETLTVAVNHFKSKGSCPGDGSLNDDQGDGQGCWNRIRTQAADALADWVANDPSGTGTERVLVIGDLNSYARENPIAALESAGFTNLLAQFGGSAAYSYVYDAQAGYLDQALASSALLPLVTGAGEWHINADEPRSLDYNTEYKTAAQQDSLYAADPYRASDHDPVLVELDLSAGNAAPTAEFTSDASGKRMRFTDTSSDSDGHIASWQWDFGDGTGSSAQNPEHRYQQRGTYTVTLQVQDDRGAGGTIQRQVRVADGGALRARFTVHRLLNWVWVQARGPQRGGLSYHWNFGDGSELQGQGGWHRYTRGGRYAIALSVRDSAGGEHSTRRNVVIHSARWLPW
ncbi:ExeM/NucH family extracellular endonuclease [Microbulbifer sp. SAOS-129_SWC]|uniref:ExeM/NucH family extracellular endonuclease n=1 Tax=Microbulbifer sp. SAOS-129_SWC TaxID=3145235 RepID=UPI003217AB93